MSAEAIKAVFDWLRDDDGDGGLCADLDGVGERLYHVTGPEDVTLADGPACVFSAAQPTLDRDFAGAIHEEIQLSFSTWLSIEASALNGPAVALDIDRRLFDRLDGESLSATGYDRVLCTCVQRGTCTVEDEAYRVDSSYLLRGTRSGA